MAFIIATQLIPNGWMTTLGSVTSQGERVLEEAQDASEEVRMGGLLSAVRRMLNVDQAAVLTVDEAGGSVDLNITLLQQQFKLPKQGGAR